MKRASIPALLIAGCALLVACDNRSPSPTPDETTMAVDGEEVTIEATPAPDATDAALPEVGKTSIADPTLINPHRVPAGDVADDTAPLTAIPARFLGQWDAIDGPCTPDSDMFMTIRPGTIGFYESQGEVTVVRRAKPGIVVALAMEGEGEKWASEYAMSLSNGGEQLATRMASETGSGTLRRRCPPLAETATP
ncbi:hypothetical protein [Citromicrobium bathyomarinum]|uniref:hypothetical protein n=1 Tax=Citromicrobium bathyomarinum TaxID=72174 RepID=UPI00315B0ABA